jgi:hypothetical protein
MAPSAEKKILSTENNVRLNRNDSFHILFMTINVDLISISPSLNRPFCSASQGRFLKSCSITALFSELSAVACPESFTFSLRRAKQRITFADVSFDWEICIDPYIGSS